MRCCADREAIVAAAPEVSARSPRRVWGAFQVDQIEQDPLSDRAAGGCGQRLYDSIGVHWQHGGHPTLVRFTMRSSSTSDRYRQGMCARSRYDATTGAAAACDDKANATAYGKIGRAHV